MTEKSKLYLDILGYTVQINSDENDILNRLDKDFSFFVKKEISQIYLKIEMNFCDPSTLTIPEKASSGQSHLCIFYDDHKKRYVDYHGKLRCLFDFAKEEAFIYSTNIEKAHEVIYLLILSRAGKALDLKGLHRVHGFGIYYNQKVCLGIMPSKGGKSTLLQAMLKDENVQLISDDTPLIDRLGNIISFPIRMGRESEYSDEFPIIDRSENLYSLDREIWGRKYLLSLRGLQNQIFTQGKINERLLLFGVRYSGTRGHIKEIGKLKAASRLLISCIIGHGLPIIFEYFWENGAEDFLKKSKIALSRGISCISLLMRFRCYEIQLGSDLDYNRKMLKERLDIN